MPGLTVIDGDLFYRRLDGTYAKMPYDNPEAVARILIDRLAPEELAKCCRDLLEHQMKKDPPKTSDLVTEYA